MIEPTDEMERAFEDAAEPCCNCGDTRAGLAAVLAIVERDYRIEPKPPWEKAQECACPPALCYSGEARALDLRCRNRS